MTEFRFIVLSTFFIVAVISLLLDSTSAVDYTEKEEGGKTKNSQDAAEKSSEQQSTIQIVGYEDGNIQRLPTQYVIQSFDRWILLTEKEGNNKLEKIPSIGDSDYINPTSISDLWWPVDIPIMQARPTLDIILQHGQPKYVASGLDVRVRTVGGDNNNNNQNWWRNHGMNSQPLAKQWTMFEAVGKSNFRVEVLIEEEKKDDDGHTQWKHISSSKEATKMAIERLGILLSGLDDSSPLSKGFHILSIPTTTTTTTEWINLPVMESVVDKSYLIFSIGTSLPDAKAVLKSKADIVAMTGTTLLAVEVTPTAPGGLSPHLPKAYQALYKQQK